MKRSYSRGTNWIILTFFMALVGFIVSCPALAGTPVDQGKPGYQGPWPVGTTPIVCLTTLYDGGSPHQVTPVQYTGSAVPPLVTKYRMYVVICNNRSNSTGNIKCRSDGVMPSLVNPVDGGVSVGDELSVGDCIVYSNKATPLADGGGPVLCISGDGGVWATSSYECIYSTIP